jgi:vanillate/3-O-methylgallate O-demethylase
MGAVTRSLQDLLDEVGDGLVGYFYHETAAPHFSRSASAGGYLPAEFTNWRDEQRAWREAAVLFDQSHHMPELFLAGPDALRLLERVGVNSFAGFAPGRAKQLVACAPRGHVIGDCILYYLQDGTFELVSGATVLDWVHYQAKTGGFDVTVRRDNATLDNPAGRRARFRFQLDGPAAGDVFAAAAGGTVPELKFFRTAQVTIAGRDVLVLRHGMAGHKGVELSGPFDDADAVRSAILAAGERHGLLRGGTRAYFSSVIESGWIGYPVPGIYTGAELRGFREWLSADGWQARTQLGGSYVAGDIEDYYVTPYELGYGRHVRFDHDFIGAQALRAIQSASGRQKVTLVWNRADVTRVWASQLGQGPRYKALEQPVSSYAFPQHDEVRTPDGCLAGLSTRCGYSNNEGEFLSLALIDAAHAEPGRELILTWGEPAGGPRKPHVERHEQTTIRATVAPVPYAATVRQLRRATVAGTSHPASANSP